MSKWIAYRIIDTKDKKGLEAAREKYSLYFIITDRMAVYKEEADKVLKSEGYEDCIVS